MGNALGTATIGRRRQISLLLAVVIIFAGALMGSVHDSLLVAALVTATGLIWSSRQWKAYLVAGIIASAGVCWAGLDPTEGSPGWKGRVIYEKLVGHLPYLKWDQIQTAVKLPRRSFQQEQSGVSENVVKLEEVRKGGVSSECYQTDLGKFWIEAPGKGLLSWLLWEITVRRDYESRAVAIRPGDTVIDAGAHVGVFTRYALQRGAGRVIAIEPDATNIGHLEANLSEEIAAGKVTLIKAGLWDQTTQLALTHIEDNSARHSFLRDKAEGVQIAGVPVMTLDEVVKQCKLERVDFIKMDIEGAERRALAGSRQTLARFKPRMAICSYHLGDDPTVIPAVVATAQPAYQVHAKAFDTNWRRFITKVLFFDAGS